MEISCTNFGAIVLFMGEVVGVVLLTKSIKKRSTEEIFILG
jgi:hypothetical protein